MDTRYKRLLVGLAVGLLGGCDPILFGPDQDEDEDFELGSDSEDADDSASEDAFSDDEFFPDDEFVDDGLSDDVGPPEPAPERLFPTRHATRPPPPISGGTLAVDAAGTWAVAADSDRDLIYGIELATGVVARVALEPGDEPGRVSFGADGRAHALLRGADSLVSFDVATGKVLGRQKVCAFPRGLAFKASAGELVVACANGELVTLSELDQTELSRQFVERDLRDVVVDGQGATWLSRYRSGELLNVEDGKVAMRVVPGQLDMLPMSATLASRAITNASGEVVVVHQRAQDGEIAPQPGGYGGGDCDSIVQTAVSTVRGTGADPSAALLAGSVAVDATYSPDGSWLAVALPGQYLDGLGTVALFSSVDLGDRLPGEACGTGPWDSTARDVQATAVVFDPAGRLLVQSREPAQLHIYDLTDAEVSVRLQAKAIIELDSSSVRDTGHDLFYARTSSGLACASCHGEGADDGHTWHFANLGPRRTQSLGGGILGSEPFHWQGDMQNFRALVDDVMVGRMSGFELADDQLTALATWIDAQPALSLELAPSEPAARGKLLFESAQVGCASCHSGPRLTNNASANIGRGETLQVPSLLGLALRAPYMHDGCAPTLKERFDPDCGGAAHGNTAQLTAAQLGDLIAYLETL